jgi:peptidoglycan/LPS O-acetylase OafA/YrhL
LPFAAAILALLVGIAGWFYLFYSRAAHRLAGLEESAANGRRRRLRRVNGLVMLVLAVLIYVGFALDPHRQPGPFIAVWITVIPLLLVVVTLALIDMRLTADIRRRLRRPEL